MGLDWICCGGLLQNALSHFGLAPFHFINFSFLILFTDMGFPLLLHSPGPVVTYLRFCSSWACVLLSLRGLKSLSLFFFPGLVFLSHLGLVFFESQRP